MKIREINELLNTGPVICCDDEVDFDVKFGFASDLMSDVLALANHDVILITGLTNIQTIRTAEMKDIKWIIFVRGKVPDDTAVELAKETGINILCTKETMFKTCGILFDHGLRGAEINR
jgi:hypothetical protein